jgi:DNA-directed RNA polymerase specialized sigma24 family protein
MHVVSAGILEHWDVLGDAQLVAHVLDGRTALFEILMRRHIERVYRTVRAAGTADGRAEEVLQQVFVAAYAGLERFDGRQPFATWLTQLAARTVATDRACHPFARARSSQ